MSDERPPMPDLGPEDMQAIFGDLSHEELMAMRPDSGRWLCCAFGCKGYGTVYDFGVFPVVRWRRKWIDLRVHVFYCSRHWPIVKKLLAEYNLQQFSHKSPQAIRQDILDIFKYYDDADIPPL